MNDVINGLFEGIGAIVSWGNVVKLYRDKHTQGVWWPAWAFFSAWGLWNLYYYPSLNQTWSFIGGVLLVGANLAWLGLLAYYAWRQKAAIKEIEERDE